MTLRRLRRSLVLSLVLLVIAATAASAAWLASGAGAGAADSDTMPTGNKPTTSVSGSDVTVSWAVSLMPSDGKPVDGYHVSRYPSGGTSDTAAIADCDGLVTATQCVEKNVPEGDWQYTVTPRQGAHWIGAESDKSDVVTVEVPTTPNFLELANADGNEVGRADHNDTVTVRFSRQLDASIICPSSGRSPTSDFTLDGNNQVEVTILDNAASSGNDLLQVSATGCGTGLRFGSIDLGSTGFVSADVTFGGAGSNRSAVGWSASTSELRVTLGRPSDHPSRGSSNPAVSDETTATYTPASGMRDLDGRDVTGTVSRSATQF